MSRSPWSIDGHLARLDAEGLQAVLPLGLPTPGLLHPRFPGNVPVAAALLGISPFGAASAEPDSWPLDTALPAEVEARGAGVPPCEARVRGRELILAFDIGDGALRFDAVWRVAPAASVPGALLVVDLIVSVHTRRLEARPEVFVASRFAMPEVLWWDAAEARAALPGTSAAFVPIARPGQRRFGALICRPAGAASSYVEMVHPADDLGTEWIEPAIRPTTPGAVESGSSPVLRAAPAAPAPVAAGARHRLFASSLEKGVLLRARVRGALVDRDGDADAAARLYAAFASADPPLGS